MTTLARLLLDAGLIQFGWFARDSMSQPFALELEMLASYPAVLQRVVTEAETALSAVHATRLLCPAAALPFGVAYALRSGIPLVYSRGAGEAPVSDLVGAYDIGHPALLLTNSVGREPLPLIAAARRVGLEIHTVATILEIRSAPQLGDLTVIPLLRLVDVVRDAVGQGRVSRGHAEAVLEWIAQ